MSVALLALAVLVSISRMQDLQAPSWQIVLVIATFFGSAVSSVYASWLIREGYGAGWPPRTVTALVFLPPVISWLVTLRIPGATLYGAIALWMLLSIFLALVQRSHRWALMGVGLLGLVLHGALNPGTPEFLADGYVGGVIYFVVLTPPTFLVSGWLWHLIARLDQARTTEGQLAVARERLRFASDLHDIQGHHLQVIALKAELADRLMTSDSPPHRATAQQAIAEVRELAEQAQAETRQLVRNLRVVSLSEELDNATGVFEAAGIATETFLDPQAETTTSMHANRLLGFAVREATTNILRHAHATRVSIRLIANGSLQLEIHNDGAPDNPGPMATQGTGLAGLRSRFTEANGQITTVQQDGVFQFRAVLPLSPPEENA